MTAEGCGNDGRRQIGFAIIFPRVNLIWHDSIIVARGVALPDYGPDYGRIMAGLWPDYGDVAYFIVLGHRFGSVGLFPAAGNR